MKKLLASLIRQIERVERRLDARRSLYLSMAMPDKAARRTQRASPLFCEFTMKTCCGATLPLRRLLIGLQSLPCCCLIATRMEYINA